jgi:hypothetical protein
LSLRIISFLLAVPLETELRIHREVLPPDRRYSKQSVKLSPGLVGDDNILLNTLPGSDRENPLIPSSLITASTGRLLISSGEKFRWYDTAGFNQGTSSVSQVKIISIVFS